MRNFLATLRGKRVFFDPLYGNHGDRLLSLAAGSLLQEAALTLAPNPRSADFILVNGGGGMAGGWSGLERLARYSREYPSHPLAVMPSSFYPARTSLASIAGARQAPMWLWAREQPSLDLLRKAGLDDNVYLELDHDLAFSLDRHPVITQLRHTPVEDIVLIVERDDWEGPTGRRRPFSPPGLDFIPQGIRTAIRKSLLGPLRRRQDRTSPFRESALRFIHQRHPESSAMTPHVADISLAETCSFEEFLEHTARASIIVTTRLHVAILGHLLKRRTYLVEGAYHKCRGVFEYSMLGGSTELLTWDDGELNP